MVSNNPTEAPMANAIDDVKGEPDYFAVHSVTGSHIGLWKDETFARNVLKEYVGGTITPLYRASPAPSQHTGWSDEAVSKALRKLAAEVGGLRTFEGELRAELGNTNWSVLMLRLAEADAALAASSIAPATGFEVKALDWELWGSGGFIARSNDLLEYSIAKGHAHYRLYVGKHNYIGAFDGESAAKAAAQADFDRRIRSSISPSVAKESGEPS